MEALFFLKGDDQMDKEKMLVACCVVSVLVVGSGIAAVVWTGGDMPGWLLAAELSLVMGLALLVGFAAAIPALAPYLRLRSVRGAGLVCVGVAAVFLPLQLIIAAGLIGAGTKLVWGSACEEDAAEHAELLVTPRVNLRQVDPRNGLLHAERDDSGATKAIDDGKLFGAQKRRALRGA
jgi:hypothetical protein